jgi:hypothetical protein
MGIQVRRGASDETIEKIIDALRGFEKDHPQAVIDLYRQSPVSVRIRVIEPSFSKLSRVERSILTWRYLDHLPDEAHGDISSMILLAPNETKTSFANYEFEEPVEIVS